MVEHVLEPRLAIVEIAVERQCVDVRLRGGRHLAALHLGDPSMREENEDIHRRRAL